jgi:hypothetical protein
MPFSNLPFPLPKEINTHFLTQRQLMDTTNNNPHIAIYTTLSITRAQLRTMADKIDARWQAIGGCPIPNPSFFHLAIPGDAPSKPGVDEKFAFVGGTLLDILRYHVCALGNKFGDAETKYSDRPGFPFDTRGCLVFTHEDVAEHGVWLVWEVYEHPGLETQARIHACRLSLEHSPEIFMLQDCDGCGMQDLVDNYDLEKSDSQ